MIKKNRHSSVLIFTLFVIFFVSSMALILAHQVSLEVKTIALYRDSLKSFFIGRSVFYLVAEELKKDKLNNAVDHYGESWFLKFQSAGGSYVKDFEGITGVKAGTYKVSLIDESGKININKATEQELSELLSNFKGVDGRKAAADIMVYKKQKHKSGNFHSVYELLEIEGIDDNIFWGEDTNDNGMLDPGEDDGDKTMPFDDADAELDPGLKDLLTTYTDGLINVNTASPEVLASMPGMNAEIAGAMAEMRKGRPFQKLEELKQLPSVSEDVFNLISDWATVRSDCFRVFINASAADSKIDRSIMAVLDRSSGSVQVNYWRQD